MTPVLGDVHQKEHNSVGNTQDEQQLVLTWDPAEYWLGTNSVVPFF